MLFGEGRLALVTGANRGIGLAVARGLGSLGFRVLAGGRETVRAREAADVLGKEGFDVEPLLIDVADDSSVAAAAERVSQRHNGLDVLVNNAGVKFEFHPCPPRSTSIELIRRTYETNVFGTMAVTLAMIPLLLRSDAGRIVNLSSGLGSLGYASDPDSVYAERALLGYSTTKTAVNAVTVQFANDLRTTAVKVNAVDPGMTRTAMTHNGVERTPQEAAQVVLRLATLPVDGPTGGFFDESGRVPW